MFGVSGVFSWIIAEIHTSGHPTPNSNQGITIVCKALVKLVASACASSSPSGEPSADKSSVPGLRTRVKELLGELHLTGGAPAKSGETEFEPLRGKRKILRKNASRTDCRAMAHNGTSAARNGGNER